MRSKFHASNPASGHDQRSTVDAPDGPADTRPSGRIIRPVPGLARAPDAVPPLRAPRQVARAGGDTISAARARVWRTARDHRLGAPFVLELALMAGIFLAYRQIRFLTRGDTDAAMANGRSVIELEQHLHVFTERAVQRAATSQMAVVHFLDRYYVFMHFSVTAAFLVWAFVRRPAAYSRIRAWFVGVTLSALVIHVAYPLAPPRMMAGHGFVDTLAIYGPRIYSTDTSKSVANQFAAMPSLHFGWAVMVAVAFIAVTRARWRWLALAHPVITLLAIVATANHYWADAAVALVLVAGAGAAVLWSSARRARPTLAVVPVVEGSWATPLRPAFASYAGATGSAPSTARSWCSPAPASVVARYRCPAQRPAAPTDVPVRLRAPAVIDLRDPARPTARCDDELVCCAS